MLGATAGLMFGAFLFAVNPLDTVKEGLDDLLGGFIDFLGNSAGQIGNYLVSSVFTVGDALIIGPLNSIGTALSEAIGGAIGIFTAPIDALTSNITLVGTAQFAATDTVLGVANIGWGLLGVFLAGIGIVVINATDFPIPFVQDAGEGFGAVFIIGGSMVGFWGFFPELSKFVFAGTFLATFIAAAFVLYNLTRQVEEGAGGENDIAA